MANFPDMPTEVQHLIARELSRFELFKLKSLNSVFLDCWMDTRWNFVMVDLDHPDSAVRRLQRVVDPFVATRPKELALIIDLRQPPLSAELTSELFDGAATVLLDSLPLLPNITSLDIEVFENLFDVATLYQRVTSLSFARKLQSLALSGPVGMLTSLWECSAHNTPFESLTRLDLDLDDDNIITQIELSFLEHFVRSLAPTLQYLDIWTTIDLSPLFDALAQPLSLSQTNSPIPFPNLTSLSLYFKTSWRDPRSLCRFLLIHNNLQHLHLVTRCITDLESEALLGAFLTELANHNDQLPSFETLDISPSATQAGLSALLTLIKRSAPTLSSLLLPFRYLTDEEAVRVVDALTGGEVRVPGMTTTTRPDRPRKLKSLDMCITRLSVPFLDLLARKLPQLETLHLCVTDIIGSDQHSFHDQLSRRRYDPNTTCSQDILHAWKLQDLLINSGRDSQRAVRAVAGAVPALARRIGYPTM